MAILAESPVIDEYFIRQLEGHAVYKGEWPEREKERMTVSM